MTKDELVEMVEAAISRQMMRTVPYARGDRMFSHVAIAAIDVVLEAAAQVCVSPHGGWVSDDRLECADEIRALVTAPSS